jgi:hypothetical protein
MAGKSVMILRVRMIRNYQQTILRNTKWFRNEQFKSMRGLVIKHYFSSKHNVPM